MQGKTHIAGGILAGELFLAGALALSSSGRIPSVPLSTAEVLSAASVGALFPDIDHRESKISNTNPAVKFLANLFELVLKHRGPIHTLPVGALLTGLIFASLTAAGISVRTVWSFTAGFGLGFFSHLVLDSLNPGGIMWKWPFRKRRYHWARIRNRTAKEWFLFAALIAADLCD